MLKTEVWFNMYSFNLKDSLFFKKFLIQWLGNYFLANEGD